MALILAEAIRRLRDLAERVQAHKLAIAATGTSVLAIAILTYFGYGVFILAASCMLVAGTFGGLAGFDLARSRYMSTLERAEREAARLGEEVAAQGGTIEVQRLLIAKHKTAARVSAELAASHLDALNELRREVSGG